MSSTERFKKVMDILEENNLSNNSRNHDFFEQLSNSELDNLNLINEIVTKIKEYDFISENNLNKYPEYIMQCLRQRQGVDKYDTSLDVELNKISKAEAFKEVLNWNGLLGGYDITIKNWIKDIYGVSLDVE